MYHEIRGTGGSITWELLSASDILSLRDCTLAAYGKTKPLKCSPLYAQDHDTPANCPCVRLGNLPAALSLTAIPRFSAQWCGHRDQRAASAEKQASFTDSKGEVRPCPISRWCQAIQGK